MIPMRELPMSELTDTELDAVSGGFFDFLNSVTQINTGVQVGVAALGSVVQALGQSNISVI